MISLIAAIGKNRELGRGGELIFRIPEDMRYFKDTTMGHKVVMGRKTWESLPGKLPGRETVVISRHEVPGADKVVHDLVGYMRENSGGLGDAQEELFVIGGGMVYFEALPYAKKLYLTEVDAEDPDADTFFPEFDKGQYTREVVKRGESGGLKYTMVIYTKNDKEEM